MCLGRALRPPLQESQSVTQNEGESTNHKAVTALFGMRLGAIVTEGQTGDEVGRRHRADRSLEVVTRFIGTI